LKSLEEDKTRLFNLGSLGMEKQKLLVYG